MTGKAIFILGPKIKLTDIGDNRLRKYGVWEDRPTQKERFGADSDEFKTWYRVLTDGENLVTAWGDDDDQTLVGHFEILDEECKDPTKIFDALYQMFGVKID